MVDFLKESKKASVDNDFKKLQEQHVAQMKALEISDISNDFANATLDLVDSKKKARKSEAKEDGQTTSSDIKYFMDSLHNYIKGGVVSAMDESYEKEDKKLKQL